MFSKLFKKRAKQKNEYINKIKAKTPISKNNDSKLINVNLKDFKISLMRLPEHLIDLASKDALKAEEEINKYEKQVMLDNKEKEKILNDYEKKSTDKVNKKQMSSAKKQHKDIDAIATNGLNTDGTSYDLPKNKKLCYTFLDYLNTYNEIKCEVCSRKELMKVSKKDFEDKNTVCAQCKKDFKEYKDYKFTKKNCMHLGEIPDCLKTLNYLEEQLISKICCMVSIHKLSSGGQFGYSSHIVNFKQDLQSFVNVLPRTVSSLKDYIIVKRGGNNDLKPNEYTVNKKKILDALIYLKANHKYYKDIKIDMHNLNELESNESNAIDFLTRYDSDLNKNSNKNAKQTNNDNQNNNDCEENLITNSGMIDTLGLTSLEHVQDFLKKNTHNLPKIDWPKVIGEPINEFKTIGYITMAFPTLFPLGTADLLESRPISIKYGEYFDYLFNYYDERFEKHPRFTYFAMNSIFRWKSISNANFFITRNHLNNLSIEELKDKLNNNDNFRNKILGCNVTLRGTTAYWRQRQQELFDMVDTLGPPTFFFTLSAADSFWPELYKFLDKKNELAKALDNKQTAKIKNRLLRENAKLAAWFFEKKSEWFFKNILKPLLKVLDFWYRKEFQFRGSVHIHGVLWCKNAPNVKLLNKYLNENSEVFKVYINYYDQFISAVKPEIENKIETSQHPCSINYNQVEDDNHLNDLVSLLNNCQTHKHTDSCYKGDKKTKQCRFKYPKKEIDQSVMEYDKIKNCYFYQPKRNDKTLNNYNRLLIEHWRANLDLQAITSDRTEIIYYVCKYTTKNEERSSLFKEFLDDFIFNYNNNKIDENLTSQKIIRQAVCKMLPNRDFSSQEVFYFLLGFKFYASSRTFKNINLFLDEDTNDDDYIYIGNKFFLPKNLKTNSSIPAYCKRAKKLEYLTLNQFYSNGTNNKNEYKPHITAKPRILKIFPINFVKDETLTCKQTLLLNVPFRNVNEICSDNNWIRAYEINKHKLPESDKEIDKLTLTQYDEIHCEEYDKERAKNKSDDENRNEKKLQWQAVSSTLPNTNVVEVELGKRDFDSDKDYWNSIPKASDSKINEFKSFLDKHKNTKLNKKELEKPNVNLNNEQQEIVNLFESQLNFVLQNKEFDIKRILVQGKAGTGKSTIINYITYKLNKTLGEDSLILVAPTGVSAVNINAATLHSTLRIFNESCPALNPTEKAKLQFKFQKCKFLILDEFSMVGCKLLYFLDQRLREITQNESPFGGLYIYFFGDIKQLVPVKDKALFTQTISSFLPLQVGRALFLLFDRCFILETICRQKGEEQKNFRDLLDNISNYNITDADFNLLNERCLNNLSVEDRSQFNNAIRLFSTREEVKEYNKQALLQLQMPIVYLKAIDNNKNGANCHFDQGLSKVLQICENCLVMLRVNLWTEIGLVNGTMGIVRRIVFKENEYPPDYEPEIILVEFLNYNGPKTKEGCVPIKRITKSCEYNKTFFQRTAFPITGSAAQTIHKSQGLTLPKAVISVGEKEFNLGLSYVAFSRVRKFTDFAIINNITKHRFLKNTTENDKLTKGKISFTLDDRIKDEKRLRLLNKNITNTPNTSILNELNNLHTKIDEDKLKNSEKRKLSKIVEKNSSSSNKKVKKDNMPKNSDNQNNKRKSDNATSKIDNTENLNTKRIMKDDNFDFFSNSESDNLEENLDHNNNELLNLNNLTLDPFSKRTLSMISLFSLFLVFSQASFISRMHYIAISMLNAVRGVY